MAWIIQHPLLPIFIAMSTAYLSQIHFTNFICLITTIDHRGKKQQHQGKAEVLDTCYYSSQLCSFVPQWQGCYIPLSLPTQTHSGFFKLKHIRYLYKFSLFYLEECLINVSWKKIFFVKPFMVLSKAHAQDFVNLITN